MQRLAKRALIAAITLSLLAAAGLTAQAAQKTFSWEATGCTA